jgi:uncharacterized RDD family membrane protein YckC
MEETVQAGRLVDDEPRPAGWYRDPAPANPAFPTTVRFWDGKQWTGRTRHATKRQRQSWEAELAREQHARAEEQARRLQAVASPARVQAMAEAQRRLVTIDGQELSGWWRRVFARVVDGILLEVLVTLVAWPFISDFFRAVRTYADQAVLAQQVGQPLPDPSDLNATLVATMAKLLLVALVVSTVYECGFLKAFGATPGKMALGIEVRLCARPGPMSWGTVLLRWFGRLVCGLIPFCLDALWPLWDPRRQAIHDHVADTQVCRR